MMHAGYPGQSSDTRKMTDCKYHMEGRCTMGDRCPFRHLPELFNSTARAQLAPHSQPSVCHFYVTGKCTKGDMCPFQHPGAQKEMQIDFDDDESPKQAQQSHVASKAVANAQAQSQAQPQAVSGQPGQVLSAKPAAVRRPEQATAPQQPLSNRLGPRPVAQRLSVQNTASAQEESSQAKKSVFQRLAGVRKAPTVQDRLSKPAPTELDSRPIKQAAKRPKDARELLMETVAAKARVGRKEAELGGRTPSSQVRKSSSEVEPTSIAQRRMVPVNRAGRNSPAAPHTPFSSPAPQESTGQRKSALERIAPIQNGSVSTSSVAAPVNPTKPRRATIEPYSSSRLRPNPTSQTPSSAPSASGGAAPAATPAAGSASAATPSSEQSGGGTDRRGRQKITWQPPTASQREDTVQEVRQSMSKRKASDAASPAVDAAAAAAEETSPSKRIKAASDPADSQQAAPAVQGLATDEQPKQEPMAHAPHPTLVAEQAKQQQQQQQAVSTTEAQPVESALDVDDNAELYMDQELEDADEDDILYDDFDDEATMRELEALG